MSLNKYSKINFDTSIVRDNDLIFNIIDNEVVMLDVNNGEYYNLNEVASDIWMYLSEPKSVKEIINRLMSHYDVGLDKCIEETMEYLKLLEDKKLIYTSNE